jgi:serpin B
MRTMGIAGYILALLVAGMAFGGKEEPKKPAPPEQAALVKGNTQFAVDLYGKVREKEGNLFLSPYSISSALAMAWGGTRGQTAEQMAKALHFGLVGEEVHLAFGGLTKDLNEGGKKGDYELSVANALWLQKDFEFLKDFLNLNKKDYGASLKNVDFRGATEEARQTINAWVEKETREKIKELIQPGVLTFDARLVLTNAIYFKGQWASMFKEKDTKNTPFKVSADRTVSVPMMNQTDSFGYAEFDDYQALELPYKGKALSMVVMLPKKADGLTALEETLDVDRLEKCFASLSRHKVIVSLPKFTTTAEFSLVEPLKALGIVDAFDQHKADFSSIDGKKDLFIMAVVHKAFVDVNEEGTEAAAATGVHFGMLSAPPPRLVFNADHPFLFLIREIRTGSLLFIGRILNPKA